MNLFAFFKRKSVSLVRAERRRRLLTVEVLEDRCVLSVYTPAQITHAYGFDQIMFGSVKGDGTGQTIAIVDAYDAPKINSDLQKFDAQFGISNNDGQGNYVLTVAYAQGTKPAYNAGWSQEATLDVQWAHAVAPGAHILLVESASNSFADLFGAVDYARNYAGVSAVSMSWGSNEFSSESSYDFHMTTPTGHAGVSFIASSGDAGAVVSYPAVSPNVLGVGGTSVQISSNGTWLSETGWSGSGGGVSAYESKPAYQSTVTQSSTKRTSPDIAYDADPNTGVYVYWTNASTNTGGWYSFGGTSAGAPQWAGLVAIVNQGRTYNTDVSLQGSLDGSSQLLPAIYNLPAADYHDITSGKAGRGRRSNSSGPGYDLVTGRGTPLAQLVVGHLVTADSNGGVNPNGSGSGSGGGAAGPGHIVLSDSPTNSGDDAQAGRPTIFIILAPRTTTVLQITFATPLASTRVEPASSPAADVAPATPVWMTFGSGADDAESAVAMFDSAEFAPADGAQTPENLLGQSGSADNSSKQNLNEATANPGVSSVLWELRLGAGAPLDAPTSAPDTLPLAFADGALSNPFWLAAAVAFFAHGAYVADNMRDPHDVPLRDPAPARR